MSKGWQKPPRKKEAVMVSTFAAVYSSDNLTKEGTQGREKTEAGNQEALRRKGRSGRKLDSPFTIGELKIALAMLCLNGY